MQAFNFETYPPPPLVVPDPRVENSVTFESHSLNRVSRVEKVLSLQGLRVEVAPSFMEIRLPTPTARVRLLVFHTIHNGATYPQLLPLFRAERADGKPKIVHPVFPDLTKNWVSISWKDTVRIIVFAPLGETYICRFLYQVA